jgi:hypothetical protein
MMQNDELQDKSVPTEFHESNNKKKNRSIRLAEEARDTLVEHNQVPCTEKAFLEATKNADRKKKGISHSTLYKNKDVHEIFSNISKPKNTPPRKKKKASKSKRSMDKILRDEYQDYAKLDVIKLLVEKIEENKDLNRRIRNLIDERNELKRQNKNQLVLLTKLKEEGKY